MWWFRKTTLPDAECEHLLHQRDAMLKILKETWVSPGGLEADRLRCTKIRRDAARKLDEVSKKLQAGCEHYLKP